MPIPSSPPPLPDDARPSLLSRIAIAFGAFFAVLGDADAALRVQAARDGALPASFPAVPTPPAESLQPAAAPALKDARPDAALQLLALLQRDARLIDFVQEDLTGHADADIGVAARLVHEGCRKVLREHFTLVPVRAEAEGSRVVLDAGFDAAAVRLTGNVVGQAPFRGTLSHRGWRATEVRLPKTAAGHAADVLAQAEVEL